VVKGRDNITMLFLENTESFGALEKEIFIENNAKEQP
jgi:hypothetical protein